MFTAPPYTTYGIINHTTNKTNFISDPEKYIVIYYIL
jgi:hypothetical protein